MQKTAIKPLTALTLFLFCWITSTVCAEDLSPPMDRAEQQLLNVFNIAARNEWPEAAQASNTLYSNFPEFRAARRLQQLIEQRKLPATTQPLPLYEQDDEYLTDNIDAEIGLRIQANQQPPPAGFIPDAVLKLGEQTDYVLLIDLNKSRLYLLKNESGTPSLLADYYVGIGKQGLMKQARGDLRTPVGIYTVTGDMADAELEELYGAGALPLDYPNSWDKRLQRRGSGIWIHGVPRDTYSRPPYSSRGCITISNHLYNGLKAFIKPGRTTVILDDRVDWLGREPQQLLRDGFERHLQQWRTDWSSLEFERYITHYSTEFQNGKKNYHKWKQYKRDVNHRKTFINIELENINIFKYPGESSLAQVDFRQHYMSNNFSAHADKRQYWQLEADGKWRIIYEERR